MHENRTEFIKEKLASKTGLLKLSNERFLITVYSESNDLNQLVQVKMISTIR